MIYAIKRPEKHGETAEDREPRLLGDFELERERLHSRKLRSFSQVACQ
jgi:hypothetical protein